MRCWRKLLCVLSVSVLCLLSACGKRMGVTGKLTGGEQQNTDALTGEQPLDDPAGDLIPKPLVRVGFVQVGHESDWRVAATRDWQQTFTEENGYRLYFVDADNDPKAQVRAVRNFIQEEMDYIVIDPILTTGWAAVLKEAYHAGIPVFVVDRTVDTDSRYYKLWLGSDFYQEGQCAGQWLENTLTECGRAEEQIRIVTILGTLGAAAQIGRTQGFGEYLQRNPNWTMLEARDGEFTENGGMQVMEYFLQEYQDIDVVICQNDNEALGACKVLDEAGISHGKDGDVIVISFDATRAGLEAVQKGAINLNIECNPLSASYAEQAIRTLEEGGALMGRTLYLPEDCYALVERETELVLGNAKRRVLPVTDKLLEERPY